MSNILSSSLSASRFSVFDKLFKDRLDAIDSEAVLIYLFDTVNAEALPFLAEQLDVLGYKGWDFTTTEQEKRDLLKASIELHRRKGTPFAVRRALQAIGFYDAIIEEGISLLYDGEGAYSGLYTYGSSSWAQFRITYDLGDSKGITSATASLLTKLIREYKSAHSQLVNNLFKATVTDTLELPQDTLSGTATFSTIEESGLNTLTYNGAIRYNGTSSYTTENDVLNVAAQMVPMEEYFPAQNIGYQGFALYNGFISYDGQAYTSYGDTAMAIRREYTNGTIDYLYAT